MRKKYSLNILILRDPKWHGYCINLVIFYYLLLDSPSKSHVELLILVIVSFDLVICGKNLF